VFNILTVIYIHIQIHKKKKKKLYIKSMRMQTVNIRSHIYPILFTIQTITFYKKICSVIGRVNTNKVTKFYDLITITRKCKHSSKENIKIRHTENPIF
jgi:hypothetical protein